MKKFLVMLLTMVLCTSFAGCDVDDEPTKEAYSPGSSQEVTGASYGLNESAAFKNLKFTATEVKETEGEGFFTPQPGNVFVGIKFTIENTSDEEQTVSTLLLFEGYADDIKCEYSFNATCAFNDGTLDGSIMPGKKLVGWYALEVPENWSTIELQVQSNWLSNKSAKFIFSK